jgi:tetratricopeptide (TPR) repeat protein
VQIHSRFVVDDEARDAFAWFARGYERRTAGDLEGAREAFERATGGTVGRLPAFSQAGALRALGELAEGRSDAEAAIALYRAALAEDPKVGVRKRLGALERGRR